MRERFFTEPAVNPENITIDSVKVHISIYPIAPIEGFITLIE